MLHNISKKDIMRFFVLKSFLPNFDFFIFPIFAFKLGHFKERTIFSYATNTQAKQQKTEKIYVLRRKKFGRINF
jgi:hypothetical protein